MRWLRRRGHSPFSSCPEPTNRTKRGACRRWTKSTLKLPIWADLQAVGLSRNSGQAWRNLPEQSSSITGCGPCLKTHTLFSGSGHKMTSPEGECFRRTSPGTSSAHDVSRPVIALPLTISRRANCEGRHVDGARAVNRQLARNVDLPSDAVTAVAILPEGQARVSVECVPVVVPAAGEPYQ
jgi:hypothetical protein